MNLDIFRQNSKEYDGPPTHVKSQKCPFLESISHENSQCQMYEKWKKKKKKDYINLRFEDNMLLGLVFLDNIMIY